MSINIHVEYRQKNITDIYSFDGVNDLSFCDNGCKICKDCILFDELINYIICDSLDILPRTMTPMAVYSNSLYWDFTTKQFLCNHLKK